MAKKRIDEEKRHQNAYTDQDIVNVLALYRLYHNARRVSQELRIPKTTVLDWIHNRNDIQKRIEYLEEKVDQTQKRMLSNMQFVMEEALQQVHSRISEASAAQAATIFGILFDKQQLMLGNQQQQTTNNIYIDTNTMSDDDKLMLMQRALQRKKEAEMLESVEITEVEGD